MKKFAAGLKKDLPAVRAGLTEPWSNGPVEGFVNKLKLVKRQWYGRAGFGPAEGEGAGCLTTARTAVRGGTRRFTKRPTEPRHHSWSDSRTSDPNNTENPTVLHRPVESTTPFFVVLGSLKGRVSFENGDIGEPILGEMRSSSSLMGKFSDRL
jgi:hypothetical protein